MSGMSPDPDTQRGSVISDNLERSDTNLEGDTNLD